MDLQLLLQNITDWFLAHGIKVFAILVVAQIINKIAGKFMNRAIARVIKDTTKEATEKRQKTLNRILTGTISVLVWLIAFMMILPEFGINVGPILAGAGILGVALGFGAQWMIRDFLAGLFIILENQYRVGDFVCLDSTCGSVEDINLRKTVIKDWDGKVHYIPNGTFKTASNLNKGSGVAKMNISVAYHEDLDKVIELVNQIGKEMAEESPWKEDIKEPVQVSGTGPDKFADSAVEIRVWGETKPMKQWGVLREFRMRVKKAFDKEGIEIPFPQMSVWPKGGWEK